jgi:outer membrane immunogenic protein
MKKVLLAVVAIFAFTSLAGVAQDNNPHKDKHKRSSWGGFYVGANLGGTTNRTNAQTSTVYSDDGYFNSTSVPAINSTGNQNLNANAFVGGGQVGYNAQVSRIVLGVEADFDSLSTSTSATGTTVYPCCAPTTFTVTQAISTSWMATQRGRLGLALTHRLLVFGTGGAAETNLKYASLFTDTYASANESASVSTTKTGWVAGGGVDFKLSHHLSVRPEYLYADFGTVSSAGTVLTTQYEGTYQWPENPFTHTASLTSSIYRFGINYRF